MKSFEFVKKIEIDCKKNLCIDFDGVIHNNHLGFHDGSIYGNIIEGSQEALKKLSKKYDLIIYTCKANPERPLVNGKTGIDLIWDWLNQHNLSQYITSITHEKPTAIAYIDDKAIKFENWNDCLNEII